MLRQSRRIGEQVDAGPHAAGETGEIAAHRLHIVHDDPGVIEQAFAGRGELDAAPAAFEKRDTERFLEALDSRAGGGERKMRAVGAARDAALIGNGDEQLKVDQIEPHGHFPVTLMVGRRGCAVSGRCFASPGEP